jgi:uncharacterized protein (DUF302 family)
MSAAPSPATNNGIVNKPSKHSVEVTVDKLKNLLEATGVTLFTEIDHAHNAEEVGMDMNPTRLLIFGSARSGTPMMKAAPTIAIDLPLKILVWEDDDGKVWVSYNSAEYLQKRHSLPEEYAPRLQIVETWANKITE